LILSKLQIKLSKKQVARKNTICKWFGTTKPKTVNVCGYNITLPMEISVEAENDILNIITEAHEKWYFENKQNIPFDRLSWYWPIRNNTIDIARKFIKIKNNYIEYTQCYNFLIAYNVLGFYDNPKKEGDYPHWQELRNISIKKTRI